MKSLVLAPFSQIALAELRSLGDVVYEPWTGTQEMYDPEELGQRLANEGFDVLVVEIDFLFEELFDAAPSLRFAAICRAALNQVDIDAATERGVVVVHTPGRNAEAVAELVIAQLFNLARHVPQSVRYLAGGSWQDPTEPYLRFKGRELAGATLGLIGLGQIGRRVAKLANGLSMRVVAHDPYVTKAPGGVELTALDDLLTRSDFVSVHVPDTEATAGLLNAERIAKLKPTAYLVNVTATSVVDRAALTDALRDGRLAGAAMDVHESHPIAPDSPFIGLPNVILTPHIGGATVETIDRYSGMVVEDLQRFATNHRPKHLANPEVWPHRKRS